MFSESKDSKPHGFKTDLKRKSIVFLEEQEECATEEDMSYLRRWLH